MQEEREKAKNRIWVITKIDVLRSRKENSLSGWGSPCNMARGGSMQVPPKSSLCSIC